MSNQLTINLGLDSLPATKDQDNAYDITRLYNACKLLAAALDEYTGRLGAESSEKSTADTSYIGSQFQNRLYRKATVAIAAGNTVSLDASGQFVLGTVGTVVGWAPSAIAAGEYGEARLLGLCQSIGGMTPGVAYYASATAGMITNTATAQKIGIALAATKIFFNPS